MEINENHLLKLEKQFEEKLESQRRYYESEIAVLQAKIDFERNKKETDREALLSKVREEVTSYYDIKNTNDLANQKEYYISELESQKQWYEEEIKRKQAETAAWHENNLKQKQEEMFLEYKNELNQKIKDVSESYEQKLLEKDKKIEELEELIKTGEKSYKDKMEALSLHISEMGKYYGNGKKPSDKIKNLKKNIKSKLSKSLIKPKTEKEQKTVKEISEPKIYDFEKPKVSVILPVYNVGKYLKQSLDSLINQTLEEIEIICVNDGSTDDCYDILEEYRAKDSRIKVIHKENKGTGAARNDGLRIATGECIGFVDPDDWVKPNMFERLYNLIKEKNLDIAMCMPDGYDEKNDKNAPFPYFVDDNWKIIPDDRIFNWRDLSPFKYPMCVWNKLYTKELFDKNKIDYAEGLDFEDHKVIFGSLLTAERIFFIREKLYVYRYNREGSVLTDNNRRLIDHMEIFNIVEKLMKDTNTFNPLREDFLQYKIHNVLYYYSMIKNEFKEEYYKNMVKCIKDTHLTQSEYDSLCEKYPELRRINLND